MVIYFVNKNSLRKWPVKLVLKSPQKEAFIWCPPVGLLSRAVLVLTLLSQFLLFFPYFMIFVITIPTVGVFKKILIRYLSSGKLMPFSAIKQKMPLFPHFTVKVNYILILSIQLWKQFSFETEQGLISNLLAQLQ